MQHITTLHFTDENFLADPGSTLRSITSRTLSAHSNMIPLLSSTDNENVPLLPVIPKGSKMRVLKDLSKNVPMKPISRIEKRNPPIQKKSKSSPILKISKSEKTEKYDKYENLEGVGRSEKSQLRKKNGNIETESISTKTTKKEKIKSGDKTDAPEVLKSYFFGENELSDFTVTTQTVSVAGDTKLSESEMDNIRKEIAGNFISPLISGIASKTVNKSCFNVLSSVPDVIEANDVESEKPETTEVEVDGYVVVEINQSRMMQECNTKNDEIKTNSSDDDTKSTDIKYVQDHNDDFEILESENIPNDGKIVPKQNKFEDKNKNENEKKREKENDVFIDIPIDASVRNRRLSYSEKCEEAFLEGNDVVECPLVEGLGQEDAFKPRRPSIKVFICTNSCEW